MISSLSNPQIKNLILLQNKGKARKEQCAFVVEGIKMVKEARNKGLIKLYVSESYWKANELELRNDFSNISIEVVTDSIFKEISDTMTPQGIMAIVKMPVYELSSLMSNPSANLIVLENLRDPGNLGTILRTGEGAGITGVILTKESVDIFNPKVIRSTMGSIYRIPFVYVENLENVLGQMKEHGISIYAAHLHGKNDYDKENYTDKSAILIGNEANGLTEEISHLSDILVKIPMEGNVESLNAAVAASILMYEVYRQRRGKLEKD